MEYDWRPGLNAILIFGGGIAFVCLVVYVAGQIEKKRAVQLEATAKSLGFEFLLNPDTEFMQGLARFWLFSVGHSWKAWNLLLGTSDATDVIVFDYQFVIGGGKHKSYSTQTVLWLRSPELKLPRFLLRPENFGDTVHGWIGGQDFDFPDHPEFSRRFLLVGDDEAAVRSAFARPVLQHFEQTSGIWVEGAGDTLLVCRRRHRVAPEQISAFVAEGLAVLSVFRK